MAESVVNSYFPSQVASDLEKMSKEYGLKVGRAIQQEWFNNDNGAARYKATKTAFIIYAYMLEANKAYKNTKMSYLLMVIYLILI